MTLPIGPQPNLRLPHSSYLAYGGLLASLAALALLPGLLAPSLDAGVFSVVGERLANGHLPYLDVFDHKPPLLYVAIALGHLIGSANAWNVAWILSVSAVALTGVLAADTLRHLGWRRSAWLVGALCVAELASFPLALGGGLTETAAVLPAAAAIRLVAVGPGTPARRLGAGVLVGVAAAVSLQAAPALLGVAVTTFLRQPVRPTWRRRLVDVGWVAAGAGSLTAGLLILLGSAGATAAAVDALVHYNGAFLQIASRDDAVSMEAIHALLVIAPVTILGLAGAVPSLRRPALRPLAAGSLAWLAAALAFVAFQGRLELHYATLLVLPLGLLAPAALNVRLGGARRTLVTGTKVALLVVAVPLAGMLISAETAMALEFRAAQAERTQAVASWIDRNVGPEGSVFVWGNAPDVYLRAGREPASEYVYLLPLTTPGYVTPALVRSVRDQWETNPPAVLVDAGSDAPGAAGLPPLLVSRPVAPGDGRTADLLDPLRQYALANYRLAAVVDGWPIYLLRQP